MSATLYETIGLVIGTFAGPADDGPDRKRWQFTLTDIAEARGYIVLDRQTVRDVIRILEESLR